MLRDCLYALDGVKLDNMTASEKEAAVYLIRVCAEISEKFKDAIHND